MIDVYFTTVRLYMVEQKDGINSNDLLGNELFINLLDLFSDKVMFSVVCVCLSVSLFTGWGRGPCTGAPAPIYLSWSPGYVQVCSTWTSQFSDMFRLVHYETATVRERAVGVSI